MQAYQYIYTSWKNGDSPEKGFMTYARSEDVTDAECNTIRAVMAYQAPGSLPPEPTAEEIAASFPYAFASFTLPTGRGCTAQATYLGRDYSGRFGNYIIYAIIYDKDALPCRTCTFFGEPFIRTYLTQEELDVLPPVPPLPPITPGFGTVIHDPELAAFCYGREAQLSQLLALLLHADAQGVPLYLNDTRENLVLWTAALQRMLPMGLSRSFAFSTYTASPVTAARDGRLALAGVRPEHFSYTAGAQSSRCVAMDLIGGIGTPVQTTDFTDAMAHSLALDAAVCDAFGAFADAAGVRKLSELEDAWHYSRLVRTGVYEGGLASLLAFGEMHGVQTGDAAPALLSGLRAEALTAEEMPALWHFLAPNAGALCFTLYDLAELWLYRTATTDPETALRVAGLLAQEEGFDGFLKFLEQGGIRPLMQRLAGQTNVPLLLFYVQLMTTHFTFPGGLDDTLPAVFMRQLTQQLAACAPDSALAQLLSACSQYERLLGDVTALCTQAVPERTQTLADAVLQRGERTTEQRLLQTTLMEPLAVQMIATAKRPEEVYRRFCREQQPLMTPELHAAAVEACLSHISPYQTPMGIPREQAAFRILADAVPEVREVLTPYLEGSTVRYLGKLPLTQLQRAAALWPEEPEVHMPKICAVLDARMLEEHGEAHTLVNAFEQSFGEHRIRPDLLDRASYDAFTARYLRSYLPLLSTTEDVDRLCALFVHPEGQQSFARAYLACMRRLERRDTLHWNRLTAQTCVSAMRSRLHGLYEAMLQYLRRYDDLELQDVFWHMRRELSESEYTAFHEALRSRGRFSLPWA